jgi:hypothetical protein
LLDGRQQGGAIPARAKGRAQEAEAFLGKTAPMPFLAEDECPFNDDRFCTVEANG